MGENKQTTVTEYLNCKLNDKELITKADAAAKSYAELGELEAKKKAASSQFAEDIKEKRSEIRKLTVEIATRSEIRPVKCTVVASWREKKMITTRLDTGERIRTRDLTKDELAMMAQPALPGTKGKGKKGEQPSLEDDVTPAEH